MGNGKQLVYFSKDINGGNPVFLDIGNEEPVSLFGVYHQVAAISDYGDVIFINRDAVKNWTNSMIADISLPNGEKASSVACLSDSLVVLSSNGQDFSSSVKLGSSILRFMPVSELNEYEIVWVPGTYKHCLAVSNDDRVFGRGTNEYGQLGQEKENQFYHSKRFLHF